MDGLDLVRSELELVLDALQRGVGLLVGVGERRVGGRVAEGELLVGDVVLDAVAGKAPSGAVPELSFAREVGTRAERFHGPDGRACEFAGDELAGQQIALGGRARDCGLQVGAFCSDLVGFSELAREPVSDRAQGVQRARHRRGRAGGWFAGAGGGRGAA